MSSVVNIFLDSTVIYTDPLFKNSFSKLLLQLQYEERVNIIISKVVVNEAINNYERQLKAIYSVIDKEIENLDRITKEKNINNLIEISNLVAKYNSFIEDKIQSSQFTIIDYEENLLPQLIERSIKRIKPFTENRQEFRDAIIWLSYVCYIKNDKSKNNFFITNNKRDFWDDNNVGLHPDLMAEMSDLKVYSNFQELCTKEEKILKIIKERNFSEWLSKKELLEEDVLNLISTKLWEFLSNKIKYKIDKLNPQLYFKDIDASYFEYNYHKENLILDNLSISQISNFAFVECKILLGGNAVIYPIHSQWSREKRSIIFNIDLTFTFDIDMTIKDCEISQIEINNPHQILGSHES